ncbi:hypothetical protein CGC20_15740 [Leishmania donovani]|uniref:Uncharacterized protein n=1 Tax=Leishmania donovani TaxID=5661 RepID=A0A504XTL6_LEIDO|nr:hypothetical protein CGC20_15740 [Leishmania donovani]
MRVPPSLPRAVRTCAPPRRPAVTSTPLFLAILLLLCTTTTSTFALVSVATPTAAQLSAAYAKTSGTADRMLMTVRGGVTAMLQTVAKGGVLYLGSHYGLSSGTVVGWATGYPQLSADGSVGDRRLRWALTNRGRGGQAWPPPANRATMSWR